MSKTILVTGANGYIAMHVIQQAIAKGHNIVASVRSSSAAEKITNVFNKAISQVSIVQVSDITSAESYKDAFRTANIAAVINTASPLINNPTDVRTQILDPAINSGTAILEAAKKYGEPCLKRIVHIGSFTACVDLSLGTGAGKIYSPKDWNPITYEEAADGGRMTAYMGSKALAEKAMWDWMSTNNPTFDFTSIYPSAVFGPHVGRIDLDNLNVSTKMLWELAMPSSNPPVYNSRHLGSWVDVRDVAEALLAAIQIPEAGSIRFLAAQRCHWQLVRDEARRQLPDLRTMIDAGDPGCWQAAKSTTYDVDGSMVTSILKVEYTSLGECLWDSYSQLLTAYNKAN